ncbi:MAG: DUF5685 family protein [Alistipes sp.]|nr:DUF5685 family protein [Alistipes sp.]
MFGYIVVNKPELKIKEFDLYREYYCGLCHRLSCRHKTAGRFALGYDYVFLILLLSGLYEPEENCEEYRCMVHPAKKQRIRYNQFTDYAADMTVVLARLKCMDDWRDEKKAVRKVYGDILGKRYEAVRKKYPDKVEIIEQCVLNLEKAQKDKEENIDIVSGYSAKIFAEVFAVYDDEWEQPLRKIGFYLGKFIYIMDAFDDLESDRKGKNYNPFETRSHEEDFEERVRNLLMVNAAECAREFEKLPIVSGQLPVLRNILYSGIWSKFTEVCDRRRKHEKSV